MGDRWRAMAALVDRSRRALYLYVRRQDHPVSREEAARAQRVTRNLAAFHLDKLVEAGLLRSRYEAPPGPRRRGRAPKVYEPAGDLSITVPERRYQLLAEILAAAVAEEPADAARAARRHAEAYGHLLGERLRGAGETEPAQVLDELGFEPSPAGVGQVDPSTAGRARAAGGLLLDNCPFQGLAERHTELVCGLNHAFITGLLAGLQVRDLAARLAPRPPACCVALVPAGAPGG